MIVEVANRNHRTLNVANVASFVKLTFCIELANDSQSNDWPDGNEGNYDPEYNKNR